MLLESFWVDEMLERCSVTLSSNTAFIMMSPDDYNIICNSSSLISFVSQRYNNIFNLVIYPYELMKESDSQNGK